MSERIHYIEELTETLQIFRHISQDRHPAGHKFRYPIEGGTCEECGWIFPPRLTTLECGHTMRDHILRTIKEIEMALDSLHGLTDYEFEALQSAGMKVNFNIVLHLGSDSPGRIISYN